jgi:hypothetical protein
MNSAALLIGMANVSSLVGLFFHSLILSKHNSLLRRRLKPVDFRIPLCLCSASAVVGNILFSYSVTISSLRMALVGRLLVGFGSAECLNRQLLPTVLAPESINAEISRLATASMSTIPIALLLGSLADMKVQERMRSYYQPQKNSTSLIANAMLSIVPTVPPGNISLVTLPAVQPPLPLYAPLNVPRGQRSLFTLKISLESIGYVMSFAWFVHLLGMVWFFEVPQTTKKISQKNRLKSHMIQEEDFDSDAENDKLQPATKNSLLESSDTNDGTLEKLQTMKRKTIKHHPHHTYSETFADVRRLMTSNVAFPTTVAILFILRAAAELIFSSFGTIMSKYFDWSGGR